MGTERGPLQRQQVYLCRIRKRVRDIAGELRDSVGHRNRRRLYSAHMRCSNPAAPQETTEMNRIIVSNDRGQLSAGSDFKDLKSYRLCPAK